MAKKRDDDAKRDELEAAETEDEAAEIADEDETVDAAPEEAAEEDAKAAADEATEEAAAEDEELAAAEAEEEPEEVEEEKPRLKPKVTGLTLTLCILNVAAALGFLFLLMLDYEKRQAFTFAAFSHEMVLSSVGTNEDKEGATAGAAAQPIPGDAFQLTIYGAEIPPDVLRELMSDLGNPVGSIEQEMARLKGALPGEIQGVAKQGVDALKDDAAKRKKIGELLYPLCRDPMQVEKLEKRISGAQGPAALDPLVQDAYERRILADILLPVEVFRPSDPERALLEKVADLDATKLEDVRDLLSRRLDAASKDKYDGSVHFGKDWDNQPRWTIEKRQNAAFILVSVAYARKHLDRNAKLEDQLLAPKGLERAQRISGLYDFTQACQAYDDAVRKLETRVLDAIALEREGFQLEANKEKRSAGFADKHVALINQIRQVQLRIRQAEERVKDLEQQRDRAAKLVEERTKLRTDVQTRIVEERAKTAKAAEELRELQKQLFDAQRVLADAVETNVQLARQIRQLSGVKEAQP